MNMEKFLYPNHLVRFIITGPSECAKSVFQTNVIYILSTNVIKYRSIHQVFIRIYINN